jgi:hypothetical protein
MTEATGRPRRANDHPARRRVISPVAILLRHHPNHTPSICRVARRCMGSGHMRQLEDSPATNPRGQYPPRPHSTGCLVASPRSPPSGMPREAARPGGTPAGAESPGGTPHPAGMQASARGDPPAGRRRERRAPGGTPDPAGAHATLPGCASGGETAPFAPLARPGVPPGRTRPGPDGTHAVIRLADATLGESSPGSRRPGWGHRAYHGSGR